MNQYKISTSRVSAAATALLAAAYLQTSVVYGAAPLTSSPAPRIMASSTIARKPPWVRPATRPAKPIGPAPAAQADGRAYKVSGFKLSYSNPRPQLPSLAELYQVKWKLARAANGWVSAYLAGPRGRPVARPGYVPVRGTLAELTRPAPQIFFTSAIQSLETQIVQFMNQHGFLGIRVTVALGAGTLRHLIIHDAVVGDVRTVASGARVGTGRTINNPMYNWIRRESPIQPVGFHDLLQKSALDDYLALLNRQPGRRVESAISPSAAPDHVTLDYLVSENKPWYAYAQLSNTGTAQTNQWVETFGVVDNQLTGHDDILQVNYFTAGFDRTEGVAGSYNFPLAPLDKLRLRLFGDWERFSASDVGLSGLQFTGENSGGGGELIANIFQHRTLFIDAVTGVRYQHTRVNNTTAEVVGAADFLMPYAALRAQDITTTTSLQADLTMQGIITMSPPHDLPALGRFNPSSWYSYVLKADGEYSFYLEPLLFPRQFEAGQSTLANQLVFSTQDQYAFDNRLVPEQESVAGGLYTVPGYPQSTVAGDSVFIVGADYRLHLTHLFPVQRTPGRFFGQPFRYAPQEPYGATDWGLVLDAFVDAGRVLVTHHEPYEANATLVGTGVGAELRYKNNITVRALWGVALNKVSALATGTVPVTRGANGFYFVFTFSY